MHYMLDKDESQRITFLRAICFILVIYLHQYVEIMNYGDSVIEMSRAPWLEAIEYIVSRIITFSAVPLFFLMSSVLLYAKEFTWKSNMKKKLKTLIVPYLLWISLYMVVYAVGQSLPFTATYFANAGRKISEFGILDFLGAYTGYFGDGIFVNALWFIRDLIIFNLLACVIKFLVDKFPFLVLSVIGILWMLAPLTEIVGINAQGICFFTLGYYIVKYNIRMERLRKIPVWQVLVLYVIMIGMKYYCHLEDSALFAPTHGMVTIFGILLLLQISGIVCNGAKDIPKVIILVAANSFFIYASHDMIQTILKKLSAKIFTQSNLVQGIEFFLIPLITCAVCLAAALCLKKILPKIYRVLTGAR